ncbi:MAG: DUF4912 domain-containing protein [Treponema sp.]
MKFTKSFLQTMSTDALLQLADKYGLFLSADLTRRLLIGELLDIDEDITENDAADSLTDLSAEQHTVHSYNITEIHVAVKNPMWFFVFWDFHEHLYKTLIKSKHFSHFFLRVHSLDPHKRTASLDFFDIELPETDRKRYVHISFDECFHRIDLMVSFSDGREQVLAQSNRISMERKNIPQQLCVAQNHANKIIRLSGLSALKTLHFQNYRQAF